MLVKKRPRGRARVAQICPFVCWHEIKRSLLEFFIQKTAPRWVVKPKIGVRQSITVKKKDFRFLAKRKPERARIRRFGRQVLGQNRISQRFARLWKIDRRSAPGFRELRRNFFQKKEKKQHRAGDPERNERLANDPPLGIFFR